MLNLVLTPLFSIVTLNKNFSSKGQPKNPNAKFVALANILSSDSVRNTGSLYVGVFRQYDLICRGESLGLTSVNPSNNAPYFTRILTPKSKSCCRPKGVREFVPSLYVHVFKKERGPWALIPGEVEAARWSLEASEPGAA
jgi:hypothetical protein